MKINDIIRVEKEKKWISKLHKHNIAVANKQAEVTADIPEPQSDSEETEISKSSSNKSSGVTRTN